MSASAEDRRIRRLRPPKPPVDPSVAHGTMLEVERRPGGVTERTVTVFLAGAECPFTCTFCDLWRWTLDGPTPPGALPRQLARALEALPRPLPERIKLYNAGNFFDRRAVPTSDLPEIARRVAPFPGVTVESHASMVGPLTLEFARLLTEQSRLEVAMGLETIHPLAVRHLNKRLEPAGFERAAGFLAEHDCDLRAFVLVGVPYVEPEASLEWAARTVTYAAHCGATTVTLIPVRAGNGELERLRSLGHFVPPRLADLETALDQCLGLAPVVTADLWDIERLPACPGCGPRRIARLGRLNVTGRAEAPIACPECGG